MTLVGEAPRRLGYTTTKAGPIDNANANPDPGPKATLSLYVLTPSIEGSTGWNVSANVVSNNNVWVKGCRDTGANIPPDPKRGPNQIPLP